MAKKIRVAVLYGGRSPEHEVSVRSAANVIEYLDTSHFEVVPIGIDKQGNWLPGHEIFTKSLKNNIVSKIGHDDEAWFDPQWISHPGKTLLANHPPLSTLEDSSFDVVFPAVHGALCEDGTLQGLLEIADKPYVGCGVLSSAVGMDKDVAKRLAHHAGINVAPYLIFKIQQWHASPEAVVEAVNTTLSFPVFVKPANAGSSLGITKVSEAAALPAALTEAFQFDTKILVEKALQVIELEVAVLESLPPQTDAIVSVVGEVRPTQREFYSYEAKYTDLNGADLIIPAPVPEAIQTQAQQMAKTLFSVLECEGMARVDLFLEKETHTIYFNEVNTLPGFTQISMYPKLMQASGYTYSDLLTHLIKLAMKRHENKSRLIRTKK